MDQPIARRDFLKIAGLSTASLMAANAAQSAPAAAQPGAAQHQKPNIVIIMSDQQRADLCRREGYPLDPTPFLDSLARQGVWFNRAYTTMPACVPARTSMFTGRWPAATHVRTNHNTMDASYAKDLVDVVKAQGYATALCGKNHSYLARERFDHWFTAMHDGSRDPNRTPQEKAFDAYLAGLHHRADTKPAPFPLECQIPYRAVSSAQKFVEKVNGQPFFLWLTFPEPHNPYQVPEPYFSMFPPDALPPTRTGAEALPVKGFKFQHTRMLAEQAYPDFAETLPRARSNYHGMLRLIDDQVKRFVTFLDQKGLRENTIIIYLSDHGDFAGEYGLMRKGPELPECLTRVPLLFTGPGIKSAAAPHAAHVSIADIMPTLCEAIGAETPEGVQGRSLWPLLKGEAYPEAEFSSVYAEHGFGGLHYDATDTLSPEKEGALKTGVSYDELNSWTQSGQMRMVRKGDWKLVFDMMGAGQLYNLAEDPAEVKNLFGKPEHQAKQGELMAELMGWMLRTQDPLPEPHARYVTKKPQRNWWRGGKAE